MNEKLYTYPYFIAYYESSSDPDLSRYAEKINDKYIYPVSIIHPKIILLAKRHWS